MVIALVLVRLCLAATFAVAGVSKISSPIRTRRSLEQFGVPSRFTGLVGTLVPVCELSVALGLALRGTVHVAAAAALTLLCVFTTAVSVSLWKGRRPDCACFGAIRPSQIGAWTIERNLLLAIPCVLLLVFVPDREFVRPDLSSGRPPATEVVLAVGLGLGLGVIGWPVLRQARREGSTPGFQKERSALFGGRVWPMFRSVRPIGLPIGTRAPQFAVPSLDGGVVTPEWLARGGRSALVVFASPACGQCASLLPAVAQLQESRGEHLRVAVVFSGDPESSRRMIDGRAIKIAATDEKAQIVRLFRLPGVPSAVLIGPKALSRVRQRLALER
jgi:uncharacterized membrane protein YphA (DoxX/SURF4 family)